MNPVIALRRRALSFPPPRISGLFPALRLSAIERARAILERDGEVLVVSLCAARALVFLRLSPGKYEAYDVGPVDDADPINCARYYRVSAKRPRHCP